MTKEEQEKYDHLVAEHKRIVEKLEHLHRGFRGVKHEDSASEMKYTTIKVYEAHLMSIEDEMRALKGEQKK